MGEYANVDSRRIYNFLKWLANHRNVDVVTGGKHPAKVTCHNTGETYPLPISHKYISKHIIKAFVEWMERNGVCTKQEFDDRI